MDHADALLKSQLFKSLSEGHRRALGRLAEERHLPKGESLCREGEVNSDLYVIIIGTVAVTQRDEGGDEEEIATLGTGSYFGELELLRGGQEASATVTTLEPTTVLAIAKKDLDGACSSDPELGYHLYRALASGLANRLAKTTRDATHYRSMVVRH